MGERLKDVIEHGREMVEKNVPEPACFVEVQTDKRVEPEKEKEQRKVKDNWFDNTDTDEPTSTQSPQFIKPQVFTKEVHEKYPVNVKSQVQTEFKKAGEISFAEELNRETVRHARLSASHLSTTLNSDVTDRRRANKNEKAVSDSETKVEKDVVKKKLVQQQIGVEPGGMLTSKRPNTSPLQKPQAKVLDRKTTPNTTPQLSPQSATMLSHMNLELPRDDSDDFIDSPENEWKTVSKKKKSAA